MVKLLLGALLAANVLFAIVIAGQAWPAMASVPRTRECRANLKGAYTAAKAFRAEKDRYSVHPYELGFAPERGNRYAYFLSFDGDIQDRSTHEKLADCPNCVGVAVDTFKYPVEMDVTWENVRRQAPWLDAGLRNGGDDFIFVCAGNLDADLDLDVWSIASFPRKQGRVVVPEGEPRQELDDRR